jgi:NADPH2:quinone reductase
MRAVVADRLGDPSVLQVKEVPTPEPGPGDVVVRVGAAGVNFPDILSVAGTYQHKQQVPFIPGMEGAGAVHAVGSEVRGWKPGDKVIFGVRPGAFAEYAKVTKPDAMMRLPEGWSEIEGAGYRVAAHTAYHSLVHRAGTKKGDVVLVHGASGGVGLAAVQLARHLGAHVIATGGDDARLAVVKKHGGADHVVNYRTTDFVAAVRELTGGHGADVIYDPVGGDAFDAALRSIAWGGRLLVIGFASGRIPQAPANYILIKNCAVMGVLWGLSLRRDPGLGEAGYKELFAWWSAGKLKPFISRKVPLEKTAEALALMMQRKVTGKIVLTTGRGE